MPAYGRKSIRRTYVVRWLAAAYQIDARLFTNCPKMYIHQPARTFPDSKSINAFTNPIFKCWQVRLGTAEAARNGGSPRTKGTTGPPTLSLIVPLLSPLVHFWERLSTARLMVRENVNVPRGYTAVDRLPPDHKAVLLSYQRGTWRWWGARSTSSASSSAALRGRRSRSWPAEKQRLGGSTEPFILNSKSVKCVWFIC